MADKIPHVAILIETARSYGRGLLRGIRKYISENGPWSVYMESRSLETTPPAWLKKWRGDGILARTASPAMASAIKGADLPTVELRASRSMPEFPFVGADNRAIGRMVTEHFVERGIRHFAVYGLDIEDYFEERTRTFVQAVSEAGFHCEVFEQRHRSEAPPDWEQNQRALAEWISELPKPIGVLTCTDQLGFWFLDACRRANVVVPDEIAVVSCENDETLSTMASPPLSSVQFHAEKTGYEAAALLDRMMQGAPPPSEPILLPPIEIVVRQSSDVVAVDDQEVADALRFIRENASKGIVVEDVLRMIPVSRASLDDRMRRSIGRSTKAQIVHVQLENVKRLLAESDLALSSIAERSGFRHPQYMAELFKKRFGITPGTYRSEVHER